MERVGSESSDGPDECRIEHGCDRDKVPSVIWLTPDPSLTYLLSIPENVLSNHESYNKNCMIIEIPECRKWEWIGGWSNKDVCYSDHDPSEGSSNYDSDASEEGSQHRQPHYPQPDTQHEEYLRMLRFHRTIDSMPLVIIEVIRQHYQKWEGMSQSDSDEGDCMDNSDNGSL